MDYNGSKLSAAWFSRFGMTGTLDIYSDPSSHPKKNPQTEDAPVCFTTDIEDNFTDEYGRGDFLQPNSWPDSRNFFIPSSFFRRAWWGWFDRHATLAERLGMFECTFQCAGRRGEEVEMSGSIAEYSAPKNEFTIIKPDGKVAKIPSTSKITGVIARRNLATFFYNASGEFQHWMKGGVVGDASDGKSLLVSRMNGDVVTLAPDYRITKTRQFIAPGRHVVEPYKLLDSHKAGLFRMGDRLVLGMW